MFPGRKGYFFIIDAFIGSAIIIFSLLTILTSAPRSPSISYDYAIAEDYSTFILSSKLQDLNNDYVTYLLTNNISRNPRYSLMEQITEFYYYGNYSVAGKLIQNVSDPLIARKYGFSFTMRDPNGNVMTLYNRSLNTLPDARVIVVSRKITFLQINQTVLFGPAIAEIKIWM